MIFKNPPKPKLTEISPMAKKVFNAMLFALVKDFLDPARAVAHSAAFPTIRGFGFEKTLELFEELIEEGYVRVATDGKDRYWFTTWNGQTYVRSGCG